MSLADNCFCQCILQRWITVFFCFLGLFNAFTMRVCLFIAITEMTVPTDKTIEFPEDTCPNKHDFVKHTNATIIDERKFRWDESTQGLILSSFFWGYFLTSISGGILADKLGGKHALGFCILSVSILTLLTPAGVHWGGSAALILIRVLMGIGQGAMYPAVNALMAKWIPGTERSWAATWAYSGEVIGYIFGLSLSGAILRHSAWGWPAVFYVFGIVGVISCLLHCALCYSRPSDNPFITESETKYLKENIKQVHRDIPSAPWRNIVRSKPTWALLIVLMGKAWGTLMMTSYMPKYMSSILRLPPDQNGYMNSIAPVCAFVFSLITSWTADRMIVKGFMSTIMVRKIGSTIALVGSGVFLVAIPYAGCNATLAVAFNTIYGVLVSCINCSIMVNALDLSPNYAGTLMGVILGIATISGFLSPYLAGELTPNQTISEWRLVFWIVFVIYAITNTVFVIMGSAEVQDWNDPLFLRKEEEEKECDDVDLKEDEIIMTNSSPSV